MWTAELQRRALGPRFQPNPLETQPTQVIQPQGPPQIQPQLYPRFQPNPSPFQTPGAGGGSDVTTKTPRLNPLAPDQSDLQWRQMRSMTAGSNQIVPSGNLLEQWQKKRGQQTQTSGGIPPERQG